MNVVGNPEEPLSINPVQMSPDKRAALAESLRNLKGESAWEDILFRRAEIELLDAAMKEVRARRQRTPNASLRSMLTEELDLLRAEKNSVFSRMNALLAREAVK